MRNNRIKEKVFHKCMKRSEERMKRSLREAIKMDMR